MSTGTVTLIKSGNRIVVSPTTPAIKELLEPILSFVSIEFLYGKERYENHGRVRSTENECYIYDHANRLSTSVGFYDRIVAALKKAGYSVQLQYLDTLRHPELFEPRWDRLYDPSWQLEFRPGQEEFLSKVAARVKQQLPSNADCPPGWGKSFLIAAIGITYPRARIHVISKRVQVIQQRIYPELCSMLPEVGICCGGKRRMDRRVMCYNFGSIHNSDGDADILVIDEVHEAAADKVAGEIGARYGRSVNIGLSATQNKRLDKKDLRVEAMCGPVVYSMSYQEAVSHKMVVPIEVHWHNVIMDVNPCDEAGDNDVEKKRRGIWRNRVRNQVIARNARADADAGHQQLITCETVEHAFALKKLLPDFTVVYAVDGIDAAHKRKLQKQGLWPEGHQVMTQEHLDKITACFERNKIKKVIATTVWNVGVNFRYLMVLNRADAGGSPIGDTQIPGRTSRPSPDGSKQYGKVHDYLDQFDRGFRQKATGRRNRYIEQGWEQKLPASRDTRPKQLILFTED